ncbi:restriction endonuclease subunit S [Nocardia gipuzkoensis]
MLINSGQVDPRIEPFRSMLLIAPNHIESGTGKLVALETAEEQGADSGKYVVREGQIIYSKIRPNLAKAVIAPSDCLCSADMYGITPDPAKLSAEFALLTLLSRPFTEYVIDSSMRVAMPKVNHDSLGAAPLWYPPLVEQRAIVDFLDRQVAKIDALIAKQEQLIETLREDRAATITQAVTKGLDPDVKLKDSGVDRLGDVPVHWSAPQIGWHTAVGNGSTPARENRMFWDGGTVPWLNSGHVNRQRIIGADQFVTETAVRECHLPMVRAGSVLIGLTGQGKTRGMASILMVPSTINQHLAYITPNSRKLDALYLVYAIRSAYNHLRELSDENGSTKGGLTCSALRKLRVPFPPIVEQVEIAEFLEQRCAKIEALIDTSNKMIETLREYRSALITDAVTGKIDVRSFVAADASAVAAQGEAK